MEKVIGLYHRVDGSLGFQEKDGSFIAVLKSPNNSIENLELKFDDPYSWSYSKKWDKYDWNLANTLKPFKVENDSMYTYYSFRLKNKEQRYRYFFKFDYKKITLAYGEFGWKEYDENHFWGDYHPFSFSWHNSSIGKYVGPKEWWTKTSWYQIFPDRFASHNNRLLPTTGKDDEIAGGNLRGIIQKLDYIKELGFNGIYLNPIFKATSNHKYDTENYFEIDEHLGTMEDFELLIKELKKRKMKIMLDGVFNHTGWKHPFWQDVLKKKENSKYVDYFSIWDVKKVNSPEAFEGTDFFDSGESKGFETFANTPTMPRLNWNNKEVQKWIIDIIQFWAKKGIDAWRMDVGDEVSFDMWRKAKTAFCEINSEGMILGEVWYDSKLFLMGDQFDSTMNYPFRNNAKDFFINKKIDIDQFIDNHIEHKYKYSWPINTGLFNVIGTHDTERIISDAKEPSDARFIIAWLLLSPGVISWYYGDEIDLKGLNGEWNRQIFNWDFDRKNKTYNLAKKLMNFREENIKYIQDDIEIKKINHGFSIILKNGIVIKFILDKKKLFIDKKEYDMR